jgi:hypothetical protein
MTVDGIGPASLAAAGSDSSDPPSPGDAAAFEQALHDGLPAAAMMILMPTVNDTLAEIQSMGDDAEGGS